MSVAVIVIFVYSFNENLHCDAIQSTYKSKILLIVLNLEIFINLLKKSNLSFVSK